MSIFDAQAEIRKLTSLDFTQTNAVVIQANKEVAAYLLSLNFDNNRGIHQHRIKNYRQSMIDGDWVVGDPIKISTEGKLVDGQHRLSAVPDEGIIPFVVLTGQPPKAAETYDQGMRRNALHVARIRGIEGLSSTHISTLRMMFTFRFPNSKDLNCFGSPAKLVDVLGLHPEVLEAIDFGMRYQGRIFGLSFAPFIAAVARAKLSDYPVSELDLDFFLHVLQGGSRSDYHGVTGRSEVAPLLLRNTYLASKGEPRNLGGSERSRFFYRAQSAILSFATGKSPKHLKLTEKNVFPVPLLDSMDFKTLKSSSSIKGRI